MKSLWQSNCLRDLMRLKLCGLVLRLFHTGAIGNRAQCRATSLIETNVLTTTPRNHPLLWNETIEYSQCGIVFRMECPIDFQHCLIYLVTSEPHKLWNCINPQKNIQVYSFVTVYCMNFIIFCRPEILLSYFRAPPRCTKSWRRHWQQMAAWCSSMVCRLLH